MQHAVSFTYCWKNDPGSLSGFLKMSQLGAMSLHEGKGNRFVYLTRHWRIYPRIIWTHTQTHRKKTLATLTHRISDLSSTTFLYHPYNTVTPLPFLLLDIPIVSKYLTGAEECEQSVYMTIMWLHIIEPLLSNGDICLRFAYMYTVRMTMGRKSCIGAVVSKPDYLAGSRKS